MLREPSLETTSCPSDGGNTVRLSYGGGFHNASIYKGVEGLEKATRPVTMHWPKGTRKGELA